MEKSSLLFPPEDWDPPITVMVGRPNKEEDGEEESSIGGDAAPGEACC